MKPLLLVNPWITDVAAYDLWAWPLGLLYWAAWLREQGYEVELLDCTDRHHPALKGAGPKNRKYHTGKYYAENWEPQPQPAQMAGRDFRRYGLPVDLFESELERFQAEKGEPQAVLVSSRMTYWYPGVHDAISRVKKRWPECPVILGGIYARLCPDHAKKFSGADVVLDRQPEMGLPNWLRENTQRPDLPDFPSHPDRWPWPALDLTGDKAARPLLTSVGCPGRCVYCASNRLWPQYLRRQPEKVFRELLESASGGDLRDVAFYDDALLMDWESYFGPFLDRVIAADMNLRFHTPNGLHYHRITPGLAEKMRWAGFTSLCLSLESIKGDQLKNWKRMGSVRQFREAVHALREAGFPRESLTVYLMAGLPGQAEEEVEQAIETVHAAGALPVVNEYSPIPGSPFWSEALKLSGNEIEDEPLWQNNNLFYTRREGFSREGMVALKELALERRKGPDLFA